MRSSTTSCTSQVAREIGDRQGEIGDRQGEGTALGGLGLAYTDLGEQPAIEFFEQAIVIAREIGDQWSEAITSWNLGLVFVESGELERAVELMEVRVALEREIGHTGAERHAAELDEIRADRGPLTEAARL